jgi:penicillin amidase/acyl-homoserine-lactone acylase
MVPELVEKILSAPPSDDPVVQEAIEVLRKCDYNANIENTSMAIAALTLEPIIRAIVYHRDPPDLMETLSKSAHILKDKYGKIDVPWGEINRIVRGDVDMAINGGPDVLRAVYGDLKDGRIIGTEGDSYILLVSWDKDGNVSSRSLVPFGSATLDKTSPHYADQLPRFVNCDPKPVWMDEAEIRKHLEREYRPGEGVELPGKEKTPAS